MSTPFKMKGMSFGNSPMKQDKGLKQSLVEKGKKGLKQSLVEKGKKVKVTPQKEGFRLMAGQQVKGEPREYFKVYSGGRKVKISESEYNTLKDS